MKLAGNNRRFQSAFRLNWLELTSCSVEDKKYESVILERNESKSTNYDNDASLVLVEKASDGMLIDGLPERCLSK